LIVEIIVLTLLMGCASGLVTTFVFWHQAGLRTLKRFMATFADGSAFTLRELEIEDTTTPARAVLWDGVRTLELKVTQHALRDLWRVSVPLGAGPRCALDVVEARYAAGSLQWTRRHGDVLTQRRGLAYRLFSNNTPEALASVQAVPVRNALAALLQQGAALRRVSVTAEGLVAEFDRHGLQRREVVGIINAVAALADVLEGLQPARRALAAADEPHRMVEHMESGSPLGLPLARARR